MSKNESVFHHILNKPKNEKRVDKTSRRETIRDEIWFFLEAGSIVLTKPPQSKLNQEKEE